MHRNGLGRMTVALAVCAGTALSAYADRAVVPASARTLSVPGSAMTIATWNDRGTPMTAVSLNGGAFAAMQAADYRIKLTYYPFDPLKGTPAVPTALTAGPENELFLVQSWAAPIQPMQEAIQAAGGTIERYVADWTLVVRLTPEAKAAVQNLPFVRWVGAYHPAYRVDQDTLSALASVSDAPARYSIETMRSGPQQQQALKAMIESMAGASVNVMTLDQYRMEATLTPAQLLAVVHRNEVNFIDPWRGPGGTDMNLIRQQGGAVPTLSTAPAPGPFTGQGVRGEIFDTEVTGAHPQWAGQAPLIHGVNGNSGTHGSSCYGINFATGTGDANATGMCPQREQGIFFHYPQVTSFGGAQTRLATNTQLVDPLGNLRGHYQTSSVGNAQITTYSTISAETDNYLFLVDLLSCQSQSNTGNMTSRPEAWAKNILSVGGVTTNETLVWTSHTSSGASFGPASDARVKPDLCHSYLQIYTTTAGVAYTQFSGTSGATPITAGHFGLLHQMWHAGVFPGHGGAPGTTVFGDTPKSSTSKALMVNQAHQYNWLAGGSNVNLTRARQGWGVAHLANLYNIRSKTFIVNETDVLTALQTKAYTVVVAAGEPALKVTMVYKDPQGNPAVQAQHRINNVDLKVTSPAGAVYWGNNGMTGSLWTVVGGAANVKDTVENVFVQNPAAGSWTVEVIAAEVVADGNPATAGVNDVKYGLVVGGATEASCYADCNLSGSLTVADFGCFQGKYVLGDMYADCNASGTLTVADFGCYQGLYVVGCP
ncbi:MAG: S8 family serine peptidase [Phycisphaerales bacterium]